MNFHQSRFSKFFLIIALEINAKTDRHEPAGESGLTFHRFCATFAAMETTSKPAADKLFLIDGYALAYRSHFAFIKNPLTNSRGEATSAVFGFIRALLQLLDEQSPEYFAVVFDTPEPTFRHKAYAAYKATRQRMPDELIAQIPKIREFSAALGANLIEYPGYEADDVMGTLARQTAKQGVQV
ncbi:hypothetical protein DCC62_30015, partial [candidate division KSB1 bacterium]